MTNRYDDRKVTVVDVYGMNRTHSNGEWLFGASVGFNIATTDGQEMGPRVEVNLAIFHDPKRTVEETEQELTKAAHELVQRFGQAPIDELLATAEAYKKANFLAPE